MKFPAHFIVGLIVHAAFAASGWSQLNLTIEIDKPPIRYVTTEAKNRISRLIEGVDAGVIQLQYDSESGYLRSLLAELEIPISSQTLVFSKTSMQVQYISPRNPRAVFFNDDTYVAWIRGSSLIEMSTTDPKLGAAFYTVTMKPLRAKFLRVNYDCLGCHATSMTAGVPGHTVRSVHPSFDGSVNAQSESFVTDHSSPFSQRWGGWYVTGLHGEMSHIGNTFLRGSRMNTGNNGNRVHLRDDFDGTGYLSQQSDIVALMVLEHQTQMHNLMTKGDFTIRKLIYDRKRRKERSSENDSVDENADEWNAQLHLVAREIVDHMLFLNEAPLTSAVKGSVVFSDDFIGRGPKDATGRSLRDFDVETRIFKYPCSYLIYSDAFDALQKPLRDEIYRQLLSVLSGESLSQRYPHLDSSTRSTILAILSETKPGLPQWFHATGQSQDESSPTAIFESVVK
ncbi:hypothetical protein Poly51_46490 [Rubripirellula tenax]|uniref:Cytochrome c domain-containing protein n=1 Tax=Rubripirellula tenax TaxID=2528015 RepID=A0A5C6EMG0_9BACT|nr:hypothetical protein [Rubripirellula tenax]TWU48746.1 hypothetical protein Poly51_46490 [Rubripirellula tenax]